MYHITIKPDTFSIDNTLLSQNPYGSTDQSINKSLAQKQHKQVCNALEQNVNFSLKKEKENKIPDIVFLASAGLSLPRLPVSLVILPNMKYAQRKAELPYIKQIFVDLKIQTVDFPTNTPFEGQAECKWFHNGELLLVGYGYRSNKETVSTLRKLLNEIYISFGITPPTVLGVHLKSFNYYHLDIAMLATSDISCLIQEGSIKDRDIYKIEKALGKAQVKIIATEDPFCLNSIIDGPNLLTHKLNNPELKAFLEEETGKTVVELDVSEYEKSGGGVRCLVFDIFDPRLIKRKKHTHSNPSSPK